MKIEDEVSIEDDIEMKFPRLHLSRMRSLVTSPGSTEWLAFSTGSTAPELVRGEKALSKTKVGNLRCKHTAVARAIIVCAASLACLWAIARPVIAQSAGSDSLNLNDAGSQVGRNVTGAVSSPAAFNGTERPDTASFRISERLLSLPGRGLSVNLDLNYDSSIYQLSKAQNNTYHVYSTPIHSRPAHGFYLGYGMLIVKNATSSCQTAVVSGIGFCQDDGHYPNFPSSALFIDSTGARHQMEKGISVDSSDLRYNADDDAPTITYPDGTRLIFGAYFSEYSDSWSGDIWLNGGATCRKSCTLYKRTYFPKKIVDRNGNYIQIFYRDGAGNDVGPTLSSIKDTLGRDIKFNWTNGNLTSITAPGFNTNTEREVVRFYTENMTRVHSFTTDSGSQNIKIISYVYLPGSKSGWHYQYSSYGMIYRVEKLLGMEVDSVTGNIISTGQVVASTEYNYPTTPSNLPFELPKYTTRTDDWMGNTAGAVVHHYHVNYLDDENLSVTTITAPDNTTSEIQKYWFHAREHAGWESTWSEGLVKEEKIVKNNLQYSKLVYSWQSTSGGPRLRQLTMTNDAGQQKTTAYDYYDPSLVGSGIWNGVFTNVREVKELGFDGAELRRITTAFETRSQWTNRWLVKLPTTVKVFAGGATLPIAQVDYTYDGDSSLTSYAGVPMYETQTPLYRGNVTSISRNTNAASPSQGVALTSTLSYDMLGNVVKSTDASDRSSLITYADSFSDNQTRNAYAYPTGVTTEIPDQSGTHGINSGLTTSTTYNFNTGLVVSVTDANAQTVSSEYDDLNNRLKKITRPDGGWTSYQYSDAPGALYVRIQALQQTTPAQQVLEARQYFDPLGRNIRSCSFEGTTWLVTDTKYNPVTRDISISNPYRVSSLSSAINPSNNWTTTTFDPLDRELTTTTPDGAQVKSAYVGTRVLLTTPSGNQRISIENALGQLTDLWEIKAADASDPELESISFPNHPEVTAGYHTSYVYDVLGNVRRSTQGVQNRYFAYDSLSRLVRVKNPEEVANSGFALSSPDPITGWNQWSAAFTFEAGGNLESKTDARSIKTTYEYDGLNRLFKRSYLYVGCGNPLGCNDLPVN